MVQKLRDFIENDQEYFIALIAGIRLTGKTTILRQLQKYYPDAVYIDLSRSEDGYGDIVNSFLNNPTGLLLLDEISYMEDYETYCQALFDIRGNSPVKFKIIITGSSSAHIVKLSNSKLGARAKLFRLPLLTFIEYLYFIGRIDSYSDYDNINGSDFTDYLQLKDLDKSDASALSITFDNNYFKALYDEVDNSNRKSGVVRSITDLDTRDLYNMMNLIAYKLSELRSYDLTLNPRVGTQERAHMSRLGTNIDLKKIDLSDALISKSVREMFGVSAADAGRLLTFMLYSGLTNIEYTYEISGFSPFDENIGAADIIHLLQNRSSDTVLERVFRSVSICLNSPLFYTRIGRDILQRFHVDQNFLFQGEIMGKMLELYVRGAISAYNIETVLTSNKLRYSKTTEVDIWNPDYNLLCEVTITNKDKRDISICKYYKNINYIRVCSSREEDCFTGNFYFVPYARLCCMIDTGDILKLAKTTISA